MCMFVGCSTVNKLFFNREKKLIVEVWVVEVVLNAHEIWRIFDPTKHSERWLFWTASSKCFFVLFPVRS